MKTNGQLFWLMLLGVALVLFAGCGRDEEINIGAVLLLTTPDGAPLPAGQDVLNGMQLAVDSANEAGGVRGKKLRLVYRDCSSDPKKAKADFRELVKEGSLCVVTMYSHVSKAVVPLALKDKTPQLAIVATAENLLDNGPWSFRYWPKASHENSAALSIMQKLKSRKAGIVYIDNAYGQSVADEMRRLLSGKGMEMVGLAFRKPDDIKGRTQTLSGCDAIYFVSFPDSILSLASLLRAELPGKAFIGTSTLALPSFTGEPIVQGMYVAAPLMYNSRFPFAMDVAKRYDEEFGRTLSHYSAIGFDAINLLVQLMNERGVHTRAELKAALEGSFVYTGAFGNVEKGKGSRDFSFILYPAVIRDNRVIYQER